MKPAAFEYARAASVEDAISLLASTRDEARPYAGGQSLGPMLNLRLARPSLLVDISAVEELAAVSEDAEALTVGAMSVHADFEDGNIADVTNGLMRHAASGIAYRAVRNRGTLGGSLAHADPAADWPPVMIALDATVRARSSDGTREISVSDLIADNLTTVLDQGEILETIRIPRLSVDARWGHYKHCLKPGDFAESLAVAVVDKARDRCRIVLAGPASPPKRLPALEDMLMDADNWSDGLANDYREAAAESVRASGFGDPSDAYQTRLHATVLTRAARDAVSR